MTKIRVIIHIDKKLWEKLEELATIKGVKVDRLIEETIHEALLNEYVERALLELADSSIYKTGFEPVKPRSDLSISELVRDMRDERANRIYQQ